MTTVQRTICSITVSPFMNQFFNFLYYHFLHHFQKLACTLLVTVRTLYCDTILSQCSTVAIHCVLRTILRQYYTPKRDRILILINIEPPKKDRKQSIKNKNSRSLSFHFDFLGLSACPMSVCGFVRIFGCSLISHEVVDKTYICAHHQNELNEEIKMMCFICRFNVYFSRNQRKCSQNGEDGILKI